MAHHLDQTTVRISHLAGLFSFQLRTPVVLNGILKDLSISCAASGVDRDRHIPLLGEKLRVPSSAPAVCPGSLRTAVNEEGDRVFLVFIKVLRFNNPPMYLANGILD